MVGQEVSRVETSLRQDIVRLENTMEESDGALFDGYNLLYDRLGRIERQIDRMAIIVEKHSIQLAKSSAL